MPLQPEFVHWLRMSHLDVIWAKRQLVKAASWSACMLRRRFRWCVMRIAFFIAQVMRNVVFSIFGDGLEVERWLSASRHSVRMIQRKLSQLVKAASKAS